MRVLFVNHTARVSGGERSLLDLVCGLPKDVVAAVACPRGELAWRVRDLGVPVFALPGTDGSLRLHPRHSARAVAEIGHAALRLRGLARCLDVDVIHANSLRAGIVSVLAARLGAPRPVVHVRDSLPRGRVSDTVRSVISGNARTIIANSHHTGKPYVTGGGAPVRVVHNAIDLDAFNPDGLDRRGCRERLGLEPDEVALGVIAQITPWKAQDDALRIVAGLHSSRPNLRLFLAGAVTFDARGTRYDNPAFERHLHALADELGIAGVVRFLGRREDVPAVLRALDLLLVPSWEEPFGRTVVEGMAMGTCVVATSVGGPTELITDGVDGRLLPPRSPGLWVREIDALLAQPERTAAMATRARAKMARGYDRASHAAAVLDAY